MDTRKCSFRLLKIVDYKGSFGLFLLIFNIQSNKNIYNHRAVHALHFLTGKLHFENPFSIFGLFLIDIGVRSDICVYNLRNIQVVYTNK